MVLPKKSFRALIMFEFIYLSTQLNISNQSATIFDFQLRNLTTINWETLNTTYVLKNATHLYLNNNSISSIENSIFETATNLQVLNLSFNNLTHLNRNIFDSMTNLSELYLNNNKIWVLKNFTFGKLKNLKILRLQYNEMTEIDKNQFLGLDNLKELYLAFNNLTSILNLTSNKRITTEKIDKNATDSHSLNQTNAIYLNNTIPTINNQSEYRTDNDSNNALEKLEKITICFNQLKEIKRNNFNGLSNLNYMRILFNKIITIENGSFVDLVNLKYLNLRGNNYLTHFFEIFYNYLIIS